MPCSLFIPDFKRCFVATGEPRLPALERLVARAARHKTSSAAEFLAPFFGLSPEQIAPAPFMHLGDSGKSDRAYRLCADFVHLAADRDQLVFMPGSLLEALPEELAGLATTFNSLFGAEGWSLELMPQGRTYLRCPGPLDVITTELDAMSGQPVFDHMPSGSDAARLKQLMNESQMLFHTHPVNRAREEVARPLINSLWLWGGGMLPAKAGASPMRVFSDLPLVRGLAAWAGKDTGIPNRNVIWEPGDFFALGLNDPRTLNRDWFGPLLQGLQHGNIEHLQLYLGGLGSFELGTAESHRFWRRGKPLVYP